jgi:Spy/CpxP family protein refolding chaperone
MKKSLIALLVVAFVTPVFANKHQGGADDDAGKEKRVEQIASELGLSEEQKTKIQASREKYKTQITDKETAYNTAREKFSGVVENPNASTSEIESAYKQKEDAQRSLQDVVFKSRMEFREVLTPEQRTKMISKRDLKMDKKHDRREKFKEMKDKRKEKNNAKSGESAPAPASN